MVSAYNSEHLLTISVCYLLCETLSMKCTLRNSYFANRLCCKWGCFSQNIWHRRRKTSIYLTTISYITAVRFSFLQTSLLHTVVRMYSCSYLCYLWNKVHKRNISSSDRKLWTRGDAEVHNTTCDEIFQLYIVFHTTFYIKRFHILFYCTSSIKLYEHHTHIAPFGSHWVT